MQARVVNVLRDIWCGNRDKTLRYRYSPPPANFLFFFFAYGQSYGEGSGSLKRYMKIQ